MNIMTKQEIEELRFLNNDIQRLSESVKDVLSSLNINLLHDHDLAQRLKEFILKERDSLQEKLNNIEIKGL